MVRGFSIRLSVESFILKDWFPVFSPPATFRTEAGERGDCILLSSPAHGVLRSCSMRFATLRFNETLAIFS